MAEPTIPLPPCVDLSAWEALPGDSSVLVADGHDIRIAVRGGQLQITDGPPKQPRIRTIAKVPRTVERVLILAGHGIPTVEAVRWLWWANIPWTMLDTESSEIIAASGPQREDPRLLRSQALAPGNQTGLDITRYLIGVKLTGQAAICRDMLRVPDAASMISELAAELDRCPELEDCRTTEAAAAVAYWQAWAERVSVPFSPADMLKVPAHWLSFTGRTSDIHDYAKNNKATCPPNAMLNYAYRVAETEAVHACHAVGLHPALGILHADKAGRDSFALDVIEAARPFCDRLVLSMLDTGLGVPRDERGKPAYLDRRFFAETREGQCRLIPPLTHKLANFAADIGATIRPHAEHAARILASSAPGSVTVPKTRGRKTTTPLSRTRSARLREDVTVNAIIPDELWGKIAAFLPEPPPGPYGHRKTGRTRDSSKERGIVAAIVAHELLGVPWGHVPAAVSAQTCKARLLDYQWSKVNGSSAWELIGAEVQGYGHLAGLAE